MNAPARAAMALLALSCAAAPLAAQRVAEVQVVPQLLRLRVGATYRAQATAYDENGVPFEPRFYWTSSNINVATVDPAGSVLGVSSGLAVITASADSGGGRRAGRITVLVQGPGTEGKRLMALDTVLAPECDEPEFSVRNAGRRCWDTRPQLRGPLTLEVPAACAMPAVTPEVFYARVLPTGEIAETRPMAGSTCAAFSQAAQTRVRELGFHPAHRGGRAVSAWTLVVVRPPTRPQVWVTPTPPEPPMPTARPGMPAPRKLPPRP